jgi:Rv0078B-related antitoxin
MIDDAMAAILRQKTPAERLAIANGMWRFARDMLRATITRQHPEWSEEEVNRMVARRLSHGAV